MKLNPLNQVRTSQDVISVFKGYNHNLSIDVGEFFDMENLSSNAYPLLSPRPQRGYLLNSAIFLNVSVRADNDDVSIMETFFLMAVENTEGVYQFVYDNGDYKLNGEVVNLYNYGITTTPSPGATFNVKVSKAIEGCVEFDDSLYFVMGDILYHYDEGSASKEVDLTYGLGERQLIPMGGRLIILPDKLIYDGTASLTPMEASWSGLHATFTPCIVGSEDATVSASAPASPVDGDYWLDISVDPNMLKRYSDLSNTWTQIATDSVMITSPGIGADFSVGDGVILSGLTGSTEVEALNGANVIKSKDANYIVLTGMMRAVSPTTLPFTAKREMPDMDFIIEVKNRLWGCKYGDSVNAVYASKLGDPTNWNCFEGLSTDSYAATVGKDGSFTGAVNYFGYPLFFKEDTLYKVHGDYPANYRVVDSPVKGVQKGAGKTLAIVGSTLFYKSRNGICAYNGSLPSEINLPFGGVKYDSSVYGASAGAFNNKYYISMRDDTNWHLFVYDTMRGLLHREDNTHASYFCATKEDLIYFDAETNDARTVNGFGTLDESKIKWMADTGEIGMTSSNSNGRTQFPEKKYIARMLIRFSMETESMIAFYVMYDSNGKWEKVASSNEPRLGTLTTEIRPKRCDHFRIKIVGEGDVKLYSLTKIYHRGSDF